MIGNNVTTYEKDVRLVGRDMDTPIHSSKTVNAINSNLKEVFAQNIMVVSTSCTQLTAEADVSVTVCNEMGTIKGKKVFLAGSSSKDIIGEDVTLAQSKVTGDVVFQSAFVKDTKIDGTLRSSEFNSLKIKGNSRVKVVKIKHTLKPLVINSQVNISGEGRSLKINMANAQLYNCVVNISPGPLRLPKPPHKTDLNVPKIVRKLNKSKGAVAEKEKQGEEEVVVKIGMKSTVEKVIFKGKGIRGIVSLPKGYDNRHDIIVKNGRKEYRPNHLKF